MRKSCKTCAKRHPSSLHGDIRRDAREMITTSRKSISTQTSICHCNSSNCCKKSSIVPMWVSHSGRPDYERLVYALLDTQSDATFILNDSCVALGVDGTPVQLSLSMMSASNQIIQSSRINGLHVLAYSGDSTIALPPTYTRDIMPTNREHIPTPSMAQRWPHLHSVTNKLIPLNECEVGLLIGYDCAIALVPREVIPPVDGGPYAQRMDLGCGIIGVTDTTHDETGGTDAIGVSHRIMVHRVPSSVSTCENQEMILSCKTMTKVVINPTQIANMMELDIKDENTELTALSCEDQMFITKLKDGIHKDADGHYVTPLPFRDSSPATLRDLPLTRRGVMATISSVFGPLGFIAPVVLKGKKILQQLCRENSDWDTPLSDTISAQWETGELLSSYLSP